MKGSDDRGRRAQRIGHEAVARVIDDPRGDARVVAERETTAGDLVGAGHRCRGHRRRDWPAPVVAIARLVDAIADIERRVHNRRHKQYERHLDSVRMKGGPTR